MLYEVITCVLPTRTARMGTLLTMKGKMNIMNAKYAEDLSPIEEGCTCYTCRNYSRAYLRHLFKAKEILASRLATWHNIHALHELMRRIRLAIEEDRFMEFREEFFEANDDYSAYK